MKFNVKHLMAVSAVALAMIGVGAEFNAVNSNNTDVHADAFTQEDEQSEVKNDAYGDKVSLNTYRNDPSQREEVEQDGDPQGQDQFYKLSPQIFKHGYNKGSKVDQESDKVTLANHFGRKKAERLLHTYIPVTITNTSKSEYKRYVRHNLRKYSRKANRARRSKHAFKRNHKRTKRTSKKLINSIKRDKKVLANKHARYFNHLIKQINYKRIKKSTKRALSKKINRRANRKYLNVYKDLIKNQKAIR